jgi:amino acid transporter
MLLVALGYRELNKAMPDSGTSFTWATRAFGPWIGWMAGWGLIAATVVVLSNLAGIAVDFFYLMLS